MRSKCLTYKFIVLRFLFFTRNFLVCFRSIRVDYLILSGSVLQPLDVLVQGRNLLIETVRRQQPCNT